MIERSTPLSETKPKVPAKWVSLLYTPPTGYDLLQKSFIEVREIGNATADPRTIDRGLLFAYLQSQENDTATLLRVKMPVLINNASAIDYSNRMIAEQLADEVIKYARQQALLFPIRKMSVVAIQVLDHLKQALIDKGRLPNLPIIRFVEAPDKSVLLEWIFPHWRIGFSIEPNVEESGWFFSSDKSAGSVIAGGQLAGFDVSWILDWVLSQLKSPARHV